MSGVLPCGVSFAVAEQRISWETTSERGCSGSVRLERLSDETTRVSVILDWGRESAMGWSSGQNQLHRDLEQLADRITRKH